MLPNYDAKAIAAVMGISFLEEEPVEPGQENAPTRAMSRQALKRKLTSGRRGPQGGVKIIMVVDSAHVEKGQKLHPKKGEVKKGAKGYILTSYRSEVPNPSPVLIEQAVERGLPRSALRHVAKWIAGSKKDNISALEYKIVPRTTLERRTDTLSPQESERTERVARLFVQARTALGTDDEAREFMTTPHPLLDGRSPIDIAKTDLGARRIEQILNSLEYGLAL